MPGGKSYTKIEIIDKIDAAKSDMPTFYRNDFINYTGKSVPENEYYSEIVSEWLLDNIELLDSIPTITRMKGYIPQRSGIPQNPNSGRVEEHIAMKLFTRYNIEGKEKTENFRIGHILHYQTPLAQTANDRTGKIDLLSYDGRSLRLLELKAPDSPETLVRCVIEAYTYLEQINHKRLIKDINEACGLDLNGNVEIVANPLVFVGSKQYEEAKENRPKLTRLIRELNAQPIYYDKNENEDYVIV